MFVLSVNEINEFKKDVLYPHILMNLVLRPLSDVNDVTWSIIISLIILLIGVTYCIVYILRMAFDELEDGDSE